VGDDIGIEGAKALAAALRTNYTLEVLEMSILLKNIIKI